MALRVNLYIDQGADFIQDIEVTDDENDLPVDLSIFTGQAQMRQHYTSVTNYSFSCVTSNNGIIQLSMTANTTDSIPAGSYVFDCELTEVSTGVRTRIVEGIVTVSPSVTR